MDNDATVLVQASKVISEPVTERKKGALNAQKNHPQPMFPSEICNFHISGLAMERMSP